MSILFLQMENIISWIILMLLFCVHAISTKNKYFDKYKNMKIVYGNMIERIEIPGGFLPDVTCISQCQSNKECLMVVHESSNGSFCALWTFNGTVDYYPIYDHTATLYAQRDCKFMSFMVCVVSFIKFFCCSRQ